MEVIEYQVNSFSTTPFLVGTAEEQLKSYERYYSRVFSVKDAFITPKRFHGWLHAGLLPLDMPEGKKTLMNLPEFIWVRLIDRLRQVGVPLEHIQQLKAYLFTEVDLQALGQQMATASTADKTRLGQMYDRAGLTEEHRQALHTELEAEVPLAPQPGIRPATVLDTVLFHLLASRDEAGVTLLPSGYFQLWMASAGEPRANTTHVYLSITEQVQIFRSSGLWEEKTEKLDELSDEEWQVIWAIRNRRAREVTVTFVEKGERRQLDITTTTVEHVKSSEMAIDLLKLGKYEDIRIKTNDGKSLHVERKKRRRF